MQAAVYHGLSDIRVEEVPTPIARASNILVKITCCLICGTDLKIWQAGNPKVVPPRILGHELVGRVIHIGDCETPLKRQDRVVLSTTISCGECSYCKLGLGNLCAMPVCVGTTYEGAFADVIEIPVRAAHHLIRVPDGVENEAAAICEPLSCAINGHEKIHVQAGDTVAIIGGGPLGAIHAELAKAEGAKQVMLIEVARERLLLLEKLKGVTLIDSSKEDPEAVVKSRTGGIGADKVIVCAPAAPAFLSAFSLVRKGGAISYFASLPKGKSDLLIDSRTIHYNELTVAGVSDSRPEHVARAVAYLSTGAIDTKSIITNRLELKDIVRGLEWMRERKCLKVAIYPDASEYLAAEEKQHGSF